jgi:diguanylate cyclase (GGDEF)-like protein
MLCAFLADRFGARKTPRLALGFILAALVTLPPPAALWVALLASVAGRGSGIAAFRPSETPRGLFALLLAVAAVEALSVLFGAALPRNAYSGLLWVLAGYLIIQGLTHTLSGTPWNPGARRRWLEGCCVPLAWFLARSHADFHWADATFLIAVVAGFQATLLRLDGTIEALRHSNLQIASRVTELDALRSISTEIVASLVPRNVFDAVDRGCRRVFDVDSCIIARVERQSTRLIVAFQSGPAAAGLTVSTPLDDPLFRRLVRSPRGIRLDDLRRDADGRNARRRSIGRRARSMIGVPLLVEDRVIGLLSLYSRNVNAYDDHQVQLLRTIGQQAAMAIENAHHYQLATIDALTGFFLRDHFFNRFDDEMRRCQRYGGRFCLLMVDLDGFKQVNDEHGHLVGDDFLREVSATIRAELRSADLACRFGGDEFCLLLPETDAEGATVIGERIRAAVVHGVIHVRGVTLNASVSIGLTVYPDHRPATVEAMLKNADDALYQAKRQGRNRVVSFAA